MRHFGFEATPFATLFSEMLLSGRPGFESRSLQTLRASNFEGFSKSQMPEKSYEVTRVSGSTFKVEYEFFSSFSHKIKSMVVIPVS